MDKTRKIDSKLITETVKKLFIEANINLGQDVICSLQDALAREESPLGRQVLEKIIDNAEIARREKMPICQDTGLAVLFIEIGQDVHIIGGDLRAAIEEGVRQAYQDGFLRKSVCDPLTRKNTQDNTPAIIHIDIVPGDRLKIIAMPKGGGSENMSAAQMLTPAAGSEGIKNFVVEKVKQAGANPCPPIIVGVGIGGSLEEACVLAKKALLRPVGEANNNDEHLAQMEKELLNSINKLGIGPGGLGGRISALAVHIEMLPCHIASLPVAVNIQCHVARHKEEII
ncbi:MAG: fumarate hydratase [Smithellaceae bacterium]|jgi:fumarate hydratase subunit alpha|nr:fumarate hydratase [Syntrophaceae bacterium]MBP8608260.1 fumarate hydratase [Syntrophaceae bacterium]NMD04508.1 fumarate hydratase [Deltaproteobacteria bacterium]